MLKQFYVYILANQKNGTLYIGKTCNLIKRVFRHRSGKIKGFTQKYMVNRLVYYEILETAESASTRERQLKKWNRQWKINLIEKNNPEWRDLYEELLTWIPAFAGTATWKVAA